MSAGTEDISPSWISATNRRLSPCIFSNSSCPLDGQSAYYEGLLNSDATPDGVSTVKHFEIPAECNRDFLIRKDFLHGALRYESLHLRHALDHRGKSYRHADARGEYPQSIRRAVFGFGFSEKNGRATSRRNTAATFPKWDIRQTVICIPSGIPFKTSSAP